LQEKVLAKIIYFHFVSQQNEPKHVLVLHFNFLLQQTLYSPSPLGFTMWFIIVCPCPFQKVATQVIN